MMFPLCHVAGIGVISNVLMGITLVLRRAYEPLDAMTMIDRYGVTATSFAPTMLSMLLQHPRLGEFSLASLRTIAYGGSSMPVETLRRAMARFPAADFVQGFGMTELSGNVLYFDPASHRLGGERSDPSCSPPPGGPWRSARSASSTTRCATSPSARSARSSSAATR